MSEKEFFERADEHINLSNEQLDKATGGEVSASMMYSLARFNAWISARGFDNSKDMLAVKADTVKYFVNEYQQMLEENMDDYISKFDDYMKQEDQNI